MADGPPDTVAIIFRGRWEQYGTLDVPPDTIIADFAAGSTFIASPDMDSRHFRGRWAFSQRADGPPDTVAIRFRGRWEQYGTLDVPPDTIIADFAVGSTFIASPDMDSRRFRGRWAFSMREDGPPDTVTFRFNMALPMSHLTRFSMISRQVVHSLHHLAWIRDIFAAGGHSQCGKTAHLTQLQSVSEAGRNNMAPLMSHLTRFSLISRQVVHSSHHLAWIRGVSEAGGKIL